MTKIPVGILGATGTVGQRLCQLLQNHPWFEIVELAASDHSAGKTYEEACAWRLNEAPPSPLMHLEVKNCDAPFESHLLFSGLDSSVAGDIESRLAHQGYAVISNSRNHRMDPDVPLLVPEINPDHLDVLPRQLQRTGGGFIITNPNCSVAGLAPALAPLHDAFGIEAVTVVTLQALSGAGYPGVPSWDIADNVIPFISGNEEEKIEMEPRKILGTLGAMGFTLADFVISASVHRVNVTDGHTLTAFVKLKKKAALKEVTDALASFRGEPQEKALPSAPKHPIHVLREADRPQPRLDRDREGGMAVSVGRLRADPIFDFKFEILVHNTIRGAAGGAILNAELLKCRNLLP